MQPWPKRNALTIGFAHAAYELRDEYLARHGEAASSSAASTSMPVSSPTTPAASSLRGTKRNGAGPRH